MVDEWSLEVNTSGELFILRNGKVVVGFDADYTLELYMALMRYYNATLNGKIN